MTLASVDVSGQVREAAKIGSELLTTVKPVEVDLGQLRENLRLTPTERVEQMLALVEFMESNGGRGRVRAAAPGRS